MSDSKTSSYGNIFKTTFLFGFVQVARLLVGVIKNKIVAVLLGPSGLGIISIYSNIINMLKTGASLGVNQSAVKDVSEANACNDAARFSRIISVTNKVVVGTTLLGLAATIILSPFLSKWGFNDNLHIWAFIFLSLAVAFDIYVDNQLAILKGMRRLRELAKATLYGSIIALVVGVPLFYIWGESGIVPSLVISAIATAVVSYYYVNKIKYKKVKLTVREIWNEGSPMIKMGVALMLSNFLSFIFNMIILGYIQRVGGLDDVGFFNAGSVLIVSYFSMVTVALNTDYYPRIAAINADNSALTEEVFKQSRVGLLLVYPLVVIFTLLSPLIIRILYSGEFSVVVNYTDIAIAGTVISVISNCYGYIFVAKQESKLYLLISLFLNVGFIPIYIFLYKIWGLYGLGLSYTFNIITQCFFYLLLCWKKYGIGISKKLIVRLLLILSTIVLTYYIRTFELAYQIALGSILLIIVAIYTYKETEKTLGISLIKYIYNKNENK